MIAGGEEAKGRDDAIGKSDLKQVGILFILCVLCTNCDVFACYRKERLISSSFSVLLPLLEKMSASFSSKLSAAAQNIHTDEGKTSKVVDNSGAKRIMRMQALKGRRGAQPGDTIIASVKEAQPRGKVKKG
ncbi:unnamed protein product [Musa hybrid cultivar]